MRKLGLVVILLGVMLYALPAHATPVLNMANAYNDLFFSNVEQWQDLDQNREISEGDIFYGILHVQNIDAPNTIWSENNVAPGLDTLTGYFVTKVLGVVVDPDTKVHINLGAAAADPNGVLTAADIAAGVVLKTWTDSATKYTQSGTVGGGSILGDIASATDGTVWASYNLGSSGYWYTHAPILPPVSPGENIGDSWIGLNMVVNNTGYTFLKINDFLESEVNTFVDMYATSNIDVSNPVKTSWMFTSQDPSTLHTTPEPGSMLLLGMGLVGLAGLRRKKVA